MPDLVEQLHTKLKERGFKITTAESCTGGLVAGAITARSGASEVFDRGYVTYTNDSKIEVLKVPEQILKDNGAVSEECAKAMVSGALKFSEADIAVSITGIAGPDGGSKEKPVGLVYIGFGKRGEDAQALELNLQGDRHEVRVQSVQSALKQALNMI